MSHRPAVDDENGLDCGIEATLLNAFLFPRVEVTAVIIKIKRLSHVVLDSVMKSHRIHREVVFCIIWKEE